jgi:glycosyltransferase involved in cell wall biosynthesis
MKILTVSSSVLPCPPSGYAGLEMVAYRQATGLAARGHTVVLAAPEGSQCPGGEVIVTGKAGNWDEAAAFSTYAHYLNSFDVVIDHSWQKHTLLAKAQGRCNPPVLSVLHAPADTMFRTPPPVDKACVVCISDDQKGHFEALFSRKARRVYNGVDGSFYRPLNVPRSDRFLFLARFSAIKGADIAIRACLVAGVGLDLVGDTQITGEPAYLEQVKAMCDGKQIRMHGGCSRGECVYWFSQAIATLAPVQRYREPFGLSPVESQCCETVCVAWNSGASRETIFDPDRNLVESEDQLIERIREIKTDGIGEDYRKACRGHASKFSIDSMVSGYESLCIEAVKTGGW